MKDLVFSYDTENGERKTKEYDTIMDFLDAIDGDSIDIPMLDYVNVKAKFFENDLNTKDCATIEDLYEHCKSIVS